ncbi:MAG: 16S rRNA (cytosine(967)-C(5))-methyltransferase RsmB [Clostridia bacterium]
MKNYINTALKILTSVFSDGKYSNMAIYGEGTNDMTTKLVLGVLEQNIKIEYILNSLFDKKPKTPIFILLKIGAYALTNLTDVPDYAIVSECVEVAKMNGKEGASGFVNAVLKKISRKEFILPSEADANYLSVTYSKPQWFIDRMIAEYGQETVVSMLQEKECNLEHLRINRKFTTVTAIKNKLMQDGIEANESSVGGLTARAVAEVKALFDAGLVTFQSPSSMLAVKALNPEDGSRILDLCSAPGGKAVYMAELCPNSKIVAVDLYRHRVDLIHKYLRRMQTFNIAPVQLDASKYNVDWQDKFDFVLLDAPCSCFGTYRKHPDVFLSRSEDEIKAVNKTQKLLADQAVKYVKVGGVLLYSTCTLFDEENGKTVDYILSKGGFKLETMEIPFENDGKLQILPHGEWDGFYMARFRRYE